MEYIASGMSGGKNNRLTKNIIAGISNHALDIIIFYYQIGNFGIEMNFATSVQNTLSEICNYPWQLICSNMRMRIEQNFIRCSMCNENLQYSPHIPALFGAGIHLPIVICTGGAFP